MGHENELELFLIGKKLTYKSLLNIVENNIKYFNLIENNKLELENEQLRLMLEMKTNNNDQNDSLQFEIPIHFGYDGEDWHKDRYPR